MCAIVQLYVIVEKSGETHSFNYVWTFLREKMAKKEEIISKVEGLLEAPLAEKDLEIYKIEYRKEGPDQILRVFLDKPEGSDPEYVSIEECEFITRYLSEELDKADMIDRKYNLEVSSPGMDRELIRESDFVRFRGRQVEVKLYEPMNGTKHLEGTLAGKKDDIIEIETDDGKLEIPGNKVAKINLAVTF